MSVSPFQRLLVRLALDREADDVFVGGSGVGGVTVDDRLYGGLVAAQATVAAARTVSDKAIHSLHAYFLRPGRPDRSIWYHVGTIKAGRNYHARTVHALQGDDCIFHLQASFARAEAGVRHQAHMPEAPAPETLPNRDQLRGRSNWRDMPIDVRLCDALASGDALPPRKRVWMRPSGPVPDDPLLHLGMLVYATDRTLLSTAWRPHAVQGELTGASLDHAIWFHAPVRFDGWLLYSMESPAAAAGRGLALAGMYRGEDGVRLATVAQEGVLRAAG